MLRSASAAGVSWTEGITQFVTLVLDHHGEGQLVLQTAYPKPRVTPPSGADLLEMPNGVFGLFWLGR